MSKLKLWKPFSLFMVLLLMSSLVAAVPAPVRANVSGITVNPYDTHIIGLPTGYRITMTTGATLSAGDNITIEFPPGTGVAGITFGWCSIRDLGVSGGMINGQQVTVTLPNIAPIIPGEQFALNFAINCGITNPSTSGPQTMTVWTTKESAHVTSSPYEITAIKNGILEYSTIQAAINDASPGDTITVPAGTYSNAVTGEVFPIVVDESVTIISSGTAANTIIDAGNVDSVATLEIRAEDVTIGGSGAGFTIIAGNNLSGIWVPLAYPAGADGLQILGNIFKTAVQGDAHGIWIEPMPTGTPDPFVIDGNSFSQATPWLDGGGQGAPGTGILIANAYAGGTISNNTAANLKYTWLTFSPEKWVAGEVVMQDADHIGIDAVGVYSNTVHDVRGRAVHFFPPKAGGEPNLVITGNVDIYNNDFYSNGDGVVIHADRDTRSITGVENITINNNNIYDNTNTAWGAATQNGVYNGQTVAVDAEDNWWGHISGPTHLANKFNIATQSGAVTDYVDYVPWLDAAYPGGSSFAPVALGTGTTYYSSIQAAIDAASADDIITCQDGTFTEDIIVNTPNLTLNSASGRDSTTIQLVDGEGINIQSGATNFTLGGAADEGFTVQSGASTNFDVQLENAPSGVEISHNTIDTTGSASQGISVGAAGATGLTVSNNNFAAEVGDGSIWGPNVVNVTISSNTFPGPGSYAIQFSGVTGTSTISGNTVSDYTGSGAIVISNGAGTSGLTISNNNISGCSNGISFAEYCAQGTPGNMTTVNVNNNTLTANTNGLRIGNSTYIFANNFTIRYNNFVGNTTYGLQNLDAAQAVAKYNYWGHASGPSHDGLNYGDDVSTLVEFRPWLVTTYTGTPPVGEVVITSPDILPGGDTSTAYSEALSVVGGTGSYTWAYYSGTLPDGLSLADGNLSGTPTALGDFEFGFQVNDGAQGTYKDCEMTIVAGVPVITTTSLPNGTIDIPYGPETLSAIGGDGSYAWDINTGDLPDGLTLEAGTGKISGTPTADGTFDFNVEVVSASLSGYKDLSITIGSAPPAGEQKLIGADDAACSGTAGAGYLCMCRFQAAQSDNMTQFKLKASTSGNVKVALYSDSSGSPGDRLNVVDTSTPVVAGWNTIDFPSTSLTLDEYYWLAFNSSASVVCYNTAPGTFRFKALAFSSDFPASAGTGFTPSGVLGLLAGWGVGLPPDAPTVDNLEKSDLTSNSARLNGQVTDTGGENPTVIIYWGEDDGGEIIANWDHNVNLGAQGEGTFYTDVSSLTPDTDYYYCCFAQNSGGSDWAGPTEQFTTLSAPVAPTVINLEESDVTSNSARLNGEVTDIGGENPTVIIYWGDNNGGETIASWDHNVNLGPKGEETFYTDVSGLSGSTTYYYRCFAQNSGGSAWAGSSESFDTLAGGGEQKLIGADDAACSGAAGAGYLCMCRFQATASGDMAEFRLKASAPGNVKVALYSDSSGSPGALLNAVNTSTPVVAGWNTITFPSTALTSGNYYWLAFNSDTAVACYNTSSGAFSFKALSFSSDFPDPAGTGFTPSGVLGLLAGWAFAVAPPAPPDTPPTLEPPKRTITFEWSAVSGATKYWLQVNTSSGFEPGTMTFEDDNISATSQDVALNVGTTYYWRVKAGNTGGWSDWSSPGSVTP